MINTSKRMSYVPQNKPYNRQSTSFGINITPHAKKRIAERGISIEEAINTIRNGKKFSTFENNNHRIMHIDYHSYGEVPEGTTVVITDRTGDTLITTSKAEIDMYEIRGGELKRKLYRNPQNFEICQPWYQKFNEEILSRIVLLPDKQNKSHPKKRTPPWYFKTPYNP